MPHESVRSAVVTAPGQAEIVTQPLPPLAPELVRIEVGGCGICGSSLPSWEGRPWFSYPLAPGALGHEAWGRITEVGGAVDDEVARTVPVGQPVAFLSDNAFTDIVDVAPSLTVGLPDAIQGPFPGEALGCAFNIAARSGFDSGQTVAVVGAGFLGCLVVALAAAAGANVIALSRRQFALDLARTMGAKEVVVLDDGDTAVTAVEELTGGALCDVVVEAVGAQEPLAIAGRLTRVRGRLVIAGFHQDGRRTVDLQLWNWRGIDVVNAHERDDVIRLDGIRAAVDAVAGGRLDPSPLYTHRVSLEQLGEGFEAMRQRPDGFMKALVVG